MRYEVVLTEHAERDLAQIHRYIGEHDSQAGAGHVLDRLLETCDSLAQDPARGSVPRESRSVGLGEYRQVHFKPYRLNFRVHGPRVIVYVIMDGRRGLQSLLARRPLVRLTA